MTPANQKQPATQSIIKAHRNYYMANGVNYQDATRMAIADANYLRLALMNAIQPTEHPH